MSKEIVTKTDLIRLISEATGLSQVSTGDVVDATLNAIKSSLKEGKKVQLIGFGSFDAVERAARTGRNPSTGKPIQIKACKVAKFKAGQDLKDAVAGDK